MAKGAALAAPIIDDQHPEEPVDETYIPEGYESVAKFLERARKLYSADADYDKTNRDMALEDLQFIAGDIWDPVVEAAREGRPCMKINSLPQFIGQVIGDRRMNKTSIKLRPLKDASAKEAQRRAAIIKGIEHRSRAERVYDKGLENQVSCGIGNWRVCMDWAENDAFDQDIFIRQIPNPLSAIWDRMSVDPTGRDARRCFVQDTVPLEEYEETWPDATPNDIFAEELGMAGGGWFEKNAVRVCEFWEMKSRKKTIALAANGEMIDITDQDLQEVLQSGKLWRHPRTGEPRVREGRVPYACMHLITGSDILAGPYELPLTRLPIIRVQGRIVEVGDDRYRYGLIRWMKDPIRGKCVWRSVMVEKLAMAPKAKYIAEDAAIEMYEEDWRNAHLSNDPVLKYKAGHKEPKPVNPPPIEAALMQETQWNAQDMKDVSGIHDASLGIRSNEVSGRAINARKVEGDVATVMYHDELNAAIQETGDVVNQLLDVCYDTVRELLAIGEDDKDMIVKVNDPNDPESLDLSKGKYAVAVETGPSFTTQRQEGAQAMMEMIKVAPDIMGLAADLIAKYQDFPGAIEIAERLRKSMVAKGLVEQEDGEKQELTPQLVEQIKQQVLKEFMETTQGKMLEVELQKEQQLVRKAEAEADEAEAKAEMAAVDAEAHPAEKAAEFLQKGDRPERSPSPKGASRSGASRRAARKPKGTQNEKN